MSTSPYRPAQPSHEPARHTHSTLPGKQSLSASLAPQVYESALASACREIAAVRQTALAAYAAVLARQDLTPIAQEIERTRIAMQVRYLLMCASQHVAALESTAHREPVVRELRDSLDAQLDRATALGVFGDANEQRLAVPRARPARRMARGTGAPADARPTTQPPVTVTRRAAGVRPGFHL